MENKEKVEQLVLLLDKSNTAYRSGDYSWFEERGLIPPTDADYDDMMNELADLDPTHPFLNKVGYEPPQISRKQELPISMLSADKCKNMDDIHKWIARNNIPPDAFAVLSPKYDGNSLLVEEVIQPGQQFKRTWTRGDSNVGLISSEHFAAIEQPTTIFYPFYTYGEVIISKKNYNKYFKGKYNPRTNQLWGPSRNIVAGAFRVDTPDERLKFVDYIRYGIHHFDGTLMDKSKQLELCNKLNKVTIPYTTIRLRLITPKLLDDLFTKWSVDYEIDGIVIDIDNADLRRELGVHVSGKYPNYMIAYKSGREEVRTTTINDIILQISKQGLAKPVATIEPVVLNGATVRRVTCNNMKYVVDNKLGPDAVINIRRSGFVIPQITEVVKPGNLILVNEKRCPICDSELIWAEPNKKGEVIDKMCSNVNCPGRRYKQVLAFFTILGVDKVGPGVIDAFYNAGFDTVKKIINMSISDIQSIEGFGAKSATDIYNSIVNKLINIPISKLQHASGFFYGLGSKKLAVINKYINDYKVEDDLTSEIQRKISEEEIISLEGFAKTTASIYLDNIDKWWKWVYDTSLLINIDWEDGTGSVDNNFSQTLEGKGVVFTGFRDADLEAEITARGGTIKSGITKNSHILIMKEKGSGTSKERKASELGQEILTIDEFTEKYLL